MTLDRWRYLVVEDQGFQRWMIEDALRQLGAASVQGVADGAAALALLQGGERFDVVVTDLDMPGMDGMEFIRHIGESAVPVRLVVCSGLDGPLIASVETMAEAYGVALLGTLPKPASAAKLAEVLARQPLPSRADGSGLKFTPASLEHGLANGQFEAYFQPKADMRTGCTVGAEALARWNHPVHGVVPARSFIAAMESAGLAGGLTEVMLEQSLRACSLWRRSGLDASVSVNLSLATDGALAERFLERAGHHQLEPRHVIVEVTEIAQAASSGRALEDLSRLRMRGFGLSIDDYGTGHSSLDQLAQVAFTELKVDQGFVRNAATRQGSRVLLESTLDMAARLGIRVVAEGVETQNEWDLLRALGCHAAQGYFVAAPMPGAEFLAWSRSEPRARR